MTAEPRPAVPTSTGTPAGVPHQEPVPAPPPPLLLVTGLSLRGTRGPVFSEVRFSAEAGQLVVLHGRSGSGRSALLLALAGRMKGLSGTGSLAGLDLLRQPREVAALVSVARIDRLIDLEPQLSVGDSITERALIDGVPSAEADATVRGLADHLGLTLDPSLLVTDLTRLDRSRLTLALACIRPARLIVFDDLDRDLDLAEQRALYAALTAVAATGPAVVASTTILDTVPAHAVVVTLPDHHHAVPAAPQHRQES